MFAKSAIQWINRNMDFRNLLKSRIVLYLFFFASLIQLFVFSAVGDYLTVSIFVLMGFLVSFFSKNMIVILCLALTVANVFKFGLVNNVGQEGFTPGNSSSSKKDDDSKKTVLEKSKNDLKLFNDSTSIPAPSPSPSPASASASSNLLKEPDVETKPSSDNTALAIAKSTVNKLSMPNDEKSRLEYKNLLELQLKLIDGIENIKPVLTEVVDKIDKIKQRDGSKSA
jgi:hypothetical protein